MMNEKIKKILIFVLGVFMISLGIIVFLECKLGSDPITVILDGLSHTFKISYSTSSIVYNATILIICLFVSRKYIGFGTVLYLILIGTFIKFSQGLLSGLNFYDMDISLKILSLFIAQISLGVGMAMVIVADIGKNSLDGIIFKIEEVTPFKYMIIRTIIDLIYTILGYIMGGVVGIGTIFSVLTTGFLVDNSIGFLNKLFKLKN